MWFSRLIRAIRRVIERLFSRLELPRPRSTCPIGWQPSVLAPVFYGVRDYGPDVGAPTPCRVFFPSVDGAVFDAPLLRGCGRYPLVLFAHGNCSEREHYKKWFDVPAQLARSGYVVVVPELPSTAHEGRPWEGSDMQLVADVLTWMRNQWRPRALLRPAPATGIVGHSWGALLAAQFAADARVSAYASLSGGWAEWPSAPPSPLGRLNMPKLFVWGSEESLASLDTGLWDLIAAPKHRVLFDRAEHWDYLPAGRSTCETRRGPCDLVGVLTMDIVSAFFGKYLPPEGWPDLGSRLPNSLIPPSLTLTTEQQFFAGGHLMGLSRIGEHAGCSVALSWENRAGATGSVTRP
jgi:pimeloyl-ACP methyl ester carboxylesterase